MQRVAASYYGSAVLGRLSCAARPGAIRARLLYLPAALPAAAFRAGPGTHGQRWQHGPSRCRAQPLADTRARAGGSTPRTSLLLHSLSLAGKTGAFLRAPIAVVPTHPSAALLPLFLQVGIVPKESSAAMGSHYSAGSSCCWQRGAFLGKLTPTHTLLLNISLNDDLPV